MSHSKHAEGLRSSRREAFGRVVRRTINVRLLSITLIIVSAVGIATYFWRLHQVSRTADALLKRAEALEKEGKLEPAADYLRRYLCFHPQDDDEFLHLAETVDTAAGVSQAQKREAVSLYLGALRLKGVPKEKKSELCVRAAELLLDLKDYTAARHRAELLLGIKELPPEEQFAVNEDNPRAQRVLALAWHGLYKRDGIGALAGANLVIAEELKRALKLNPGDIQLATTLARVYREEPDLLSKEEQEGFGKAE
jgi:tetratricopeptide (TPR) repeat protein